MLACHKPVKKKKPSQKDKSLIFPLVYTKAVRFATAEGRRFWNFALKLFVMSSVRRALFKEGSNSWVAETIDEKQSIDDVENNSTEIVEYTVVSEGDVTFKTQLLENQRGLKTPQEKLLQRGTSSFYERVNYKDGVVYLLYEKYRKNYMYLTCNNLYTYLFHTCSDFKTSHL